MRPGAKPALDQTERDRVVNDLDQTLVVEAGAGTGKTTALVRRIERLVASGRASIEQIAAITFTRAAASELRERIRERFEALSRSNDSDATEQARARTALDDLDQAAIQTIDSFALSILRAFPLEAGLPLVVEPLDETQADLKFEEWWTKWVDEVLTGDEEVVRDFERCLRLGLDRPVENLREIASAFHERYEALRDIRFELKTEVVRVAGKELVTSLPQMHDLLQYSKLGPSDRLYVHLQMVIGLAEDVARSGPDTDPALWTLAQSPKISTGDGNQRNWDRTPEGTNAAKVAKELLRELQDRVACELQQARSQAFAPVLDALRGAVLEYADSRRSNGQAEFHDLLVWTRDLLQASAEVRRKLGERYTHILIDEFQDTDPLQIEVAEMLTRDPTTETPRPGALFAVGDPKQSIYRFRGADPTGMVRVSSAPGRGRAYLVETYRSHQALVEWVNHVFGQWIGDGDPRGGQAQYVPLQTSRAPEHAEILLGVYHLGDAMEVRNIELARREEVRELVRLARAVGAGQWTVQEREGGARPSSYGDLAILFPRRTSLLLLERALEEAGVPYSLEGQSLIFGSQDVRDLVAALSAIDDPTNEVAVVAALKSPAFGCSDVDLYRWVRAGQRFDYLLEHPRTDPAEPDRGLAAVRTALLKLREFHEERYRLSNPELIEEFVRNRRLRELTYSSNRYRERQRLISTVIEQARSLADAGAPSLREFLDWVREREARNERMPEGGIGEVGLNAVRLMTVHHAKGLEFPIVALTGLNSGGNGRPGPVLFGERSGAPHVAARIGTEARRFELGDYETLKTEDARLQQLEQARLMYVAATRARDYLIVSTYRKSAKNDTTPAGEITRLLDGADHLWRPLPAFREAPHAEPARTEPFGAPDHRTAWSADRDQLVERMKKPSAVAATALKDTRVDLREGPPDAPEERVWRPGASSKEATALGRSVHAILETVNFETRRDLEDLANRETEAEGIAEQADLAAELVRAVLGTPLIQRAVASADLHREVYVAIPLNEAEDAPVLEGYIDLMFRDERGEWAVVDYKTDAVAGRSLEEMAAPYRTQLGAYAAAVERASGTRVAEAWLLFARRAQAGLPAEYRVPDLESAISEAVRAASAAIE